MTDRDVQPKPDRTGPATAAQIFGWSALGSAGAALVTLWSLPISDPQRKDLEDLILIPLALGIVSVGFAMVAIVAGFLALVAGGGRLPLRVAAPAACCTAFILLALLLIGRGL